MTGSYAPAVAPVGPTSAPYFGATGEPSLMTHRLCRFLSHPVSMDGIASRFSAKLTTIESATGVSCRRTVVGAWPHASLNLAAGEGIGNLRAASTSNRVPRPKTPSDTTGDLPKETVSLKHDWGTQPYELNV
jgi:hypothetical protein